MKFEIPASSHRLIDTWLHTRVYPRLLDVQRASEEFENSISLDKFNRELPYEGAIGGGLTYCFTPTSLGTIVKVRHSSGEELDLTFYEDW